MKKMDRMVNWMLKENITFCQLCILHFQQLEKEGTEIVANLMLPISVESRA